MALESSKGVVVPQRQRFSVDLKPAETTIVSWKKLIKDSNRAIRSSSGLEPPAGAHPALESRIAPEAVPGGSDINEGVPPSNRFNAVIEKIERLYKGAQSSDEEELDDIPDEDQYDTDDSFIDDTELDEYFQVDKLQTKHTGFFVNRGNLEKVEPASIPNHAPKKRRRRDLNQPAIPGIELSQKHLKMGGMRMKTAARAAPPAVKSPSLFNVGEQYQDTTIVPSTANGVLRASTPMVADPTVRAKKKWRLSPAQKEEGGKVVDPIPGNYKVANSDALDAMQHVLLDKAGPAEVKKAVNETNKLTLSSKTPHKEKGRHSYSTGTDCGSNNSTQKLKSPSPISREGSAVRPKGTMLERAIVELEKRVAESRPPAMDIQDTDPSNQGIKRRLPRDVKMKLAKVARLAQSSQGKISDELINRLMSILGHLVQVKTLKKNLKEMVEMGLSAKQEKEDRFQRIKKEVTEMIRTRVASLKSKEASGVNQLDLKASYRIDDATEDKLCDLYDLYVEGMDEDKGPQIRKLYAELAELWPGGWMDNHGIKLAVIRSKERRMRGHKIQQDGERVKRKKLSVVRTDESVRVGGSIAVESNASMHLRQLLDRPAAESNFHGPSSTLHDGATSHRSDSSANGTMLRPEMMKVSLGPNLNDPPEAQPHRGDGFPKKLKRKFEYEPGGGQDFQKLNKGVANNAIMPPNHKLSSQVVSSLAGVLTKNN